MPLDKWYILTSICKYHFIDSSMLLLLTSLCLVRRRNSLCFCRIHAHGFETSRTGFIDLAAPISSPNKRWNYLFCCTVSRTRDTRLFSRARCQLRYGLYIVQGTLWQMQSCFFFKRKKKSRWKNNILNFLDMFILQYIMASQIKYILSKEHYNYNNSSHRPCACLLLLIVWKYFSRFGIITLHYIHIQVYW